MAILITRNSDTPTISSNDYARMIRYSCGGYNGITKGYGNECQVSSSANNIKIANGEIVWQGWQTIISASGESIPIDIINEKRYYSIYLTIDLSVSNQSSTFNVLYSTVDYPNIEPGDDLTINSNGIAKALFAHFTVTSGVISNIVKLMNTLTFNVCPDLPQTDYSNNIANTSFVKDSIKNKDYYYKKIFSSINGVPIAKSNASAATVVFTHTESLMGKTLAIEFTICESSNTDTYSPKPCNIAYVKMAQSYGHSFDFCNSIDVHTLSPYSYPILSSGYIWSGAIYDEPKQLKMFFQSCDFTNDAKFTSDYTKNLRIFNVYEIFT